MARRSSSDNKNNTRRSRFCTLRLLLPTYPNRQLKSTRFQTQGKVGIEHSNRGFHHRCIECVHFREQSNFLVHNPVKSAVLPQNEDYRLTNIPDTARCKNRRFWDQVTACITEGGTTSIIPQTWLFYHKTRALPPTRHAAKTSILGTGTGNVGCLDTALYISRIWTMTRDTCVNASLHFTELWDA